MYSILIVDDEAITRQGLIGYISLMGNAYAEVTEASFASQALEIAKRRRFDMIITDIRMPGMDGLDLISALDATQPQAVYIVLSGYSDFGYAQRAIKLGVLEYLLKPLDKKSFLAALRRAEGKLRNKDAKIQEQYLLCWDSVIQTHLQEHMDESSLQNIPFPLNRPYKVALYQFPFSMADGQARLQKACGADMLALGSYPDLIYVLMGAREKAPQIPGCFSTGVSDDCEGARAFADAYRQAYCRARAIVYKLPARDRELQSEGAAAETERLLNAVKAGNERSVAEGLAAWMARVRSGALSPFVIDREIEKAAAELEAMLGKRSHKTPVRRLKTPQSYVSWDQIVIDLKSTLQSAVDSQIVKLENSGHKRMIAATLDYLQANYQLFDLSLSDAANHIGISSTYLSSLFKQEKGASFIDYLTQLRLDKAKKLLVNSAGKIQEISQAVGYRDVKYFNRLFKKHVGVTPTEYRRFS